MFDFILGILATVNISTILTVDRIATPLRKYFGIKHHNNWPSEETKLTGIKGFVGEVLWCFKCTTVWVSFFLTFLYWLNKKLYWWFTIPFNISWLAWYINELSRR